MKKIIQLMTIPVLLLSACATPYVPENFVLPPHATVNGKTLGQYSAEWWQWTNSMPASQSPLQDTTGEKCAVGQRGDVWFLAGTYGSGKVSRYCEIAKEKYIFFPVINMVYWPPDGETGECQDMQRGAALNNDELLQIVVELDGQPISNARSHREKTDACFDFYARVPRELNPPKAYPAASDGYWIMLKPLPVGQHILRYTASYNRPQGAYGDMVQNIEYRIKVQ